MKLTLDHTQRLNLHALLGAQRADVGSIRAIWSVQDRIALDADEERAVELKREMVAGQERLVWNAALSVPPRSLSSPMRRPPASGRRSRRGNLTLLALIALGCSHLSRHCSQQEMGTTIQTSRRSCTRIQDKNDCCDEFCSLHCHEQIAII